MSVDWCIGKTDELVRQLSILDLGFSMVNILGGTQYISLSLRSEEKIKIRWRPEDQTTMSIMNTCF